MNAKDFKDLTGENPEDMFGGDWEAMLEEYDPAEHCLGDKHYDKCAGCAMCER